MWIHVISVCHEIIICLGCCLFLLDFCRSRMSSLDDHDCQLALQSKRVCSDGLETSEIVHSSHRVIYQGQRFSLAFDALRIY